MRLVACGAELPECFAPLAAACNPAGFKKFDSPPAAAPGRGIGTSQPLLTRCDCCFLLAHRFNPVCLGFSNAEICWTCFMRHKRRPECGYPPSRRTLWSADVRVALLL